MNESNKLNVGIIVFYVLFAMAVCLIVFEVINDKNTTTIEETTPEETTPEKTTPEEVIPWDPVMPEETIIIISEDMQYILC